MSARRRLAAILIIVAGACGGGPQSVTGVVIEVDGGITEVERFLLQLEDGSTIWLEPAPDVLFHDSAPIGHIRDHLRSGEPIHVEYEVLESGAAVAHSVGD